MKLAVGALVLVLASVLALFLTGCGKSGDGADTAAAPEPQLANVDAERIANTDAEPGQWMSHGRTYSEQRFSPLTQINSENVGELGLAWYGEFDTNRGQESTPLFIDGVIYVSTAWSKVYAYDARTGQELWKFDPKVPGQSGTQACCDVVSRGIAAWNGKIYVGTVDGRLIAVDAQTGQEVWSTQTIDANLEGRSYTITGAPRAAKGLVLIGNSGAEFGVRGFVTAYDAETGEQRWRFWTVPGNPSDGFENAAMEMAAETWSGEWWVVGGGGTVWDAIVYDPVTDLFYIGVGNGSPWDGELRSPGDGDNLFLSSIVAVRSETGEYVWHYQTTPDETWDYTATQPIMTADLEIDGEMRHVLMQAPKNGFFYVLDAFTGEFLSAEAIVPQNWALGFDEGGRPIQNPAARFDRTGEGAIVIPGGGGAHSWHPWSYNPGTGLVYIPAMLTTFAYQTQENFTYREGVTNSGVDFGAGNALYDQPGAQERLSEGFLLAWNPVTQTEAWRVSFGSGRGGGTLSTAGDLVFQGNSANREFAAYRADNGEKLWSLPVHTGIVAGAISFELDGEQYVAVAAGNNQNGDYYASNNSRLLVFKLGGSAVLPEPVEFLPAPINPPADEQPAQLVQAGAELFSANCAMCHDPATGRGLFPDLRRSVRLNAQEAFDSVVLHGALEENGMANFSAVLDEEDTQALRAYLISTAQQALLAEGPGGGADGPGAGPAAQPEPPIGDNDAGDED